MVNTLSYLALGDSYTIGEAVEQADSFPYLLVQLLNDNGVKVDKPKVIAQTGWTTDELQHAIQAAQLNGIYDMVTLLIGVNNQYRGYSITKYREEFIALLQQAIDFAGGKRERVFVLSIPDWGVTEFGRQSGRDLATISREIDDFNVVNRTEALARGVAYIDITPISRQEKPSLVASDGLHPSGEMYAEWVQLLAVQTRRVLGVRS